MGSKEHFSTKIFTATVCLWLLLCPRMSCAKRRWRRASHLKLMEKYDDYEYPLPSHGTPYQNDRCPPPPQTLPDRACEVPSCRSDSECERHKRCCYNGCIYVCLESVPPPPVLDWLVQPKPRWLGGNGWLLDGPEEVLQGTVATGKTCASFGSNDILLKHAAPLRMGMSLSTVRQDTNVTSLILAMLPRVSPTGGSVSSYVVTPMDGI